MRCRCYRLPAVVALICLGLVGPAAAQPANQVSLTAVGQATWVRVDLSLDIGGTLPAEWVGWVVDRSTVGDCGDPDVAIIGTQAFPAGAQDYQLYDFAPVAGVTYFYRIFAVDAEGARHALPGIPDWSPVYSQFDYGALGGAGAVARGRLYSEALSILVEPCPDGCWAGISFLPELPPELALYVDTAQTIRLDGVLDAEFEGNYVSQITGWSVEPDCFPVRAEVAGWGSLKAAYR